MRTLLIATTNAGKVQEITEALRNVPVTLFTPAHLGIGEAPKETSDTFEANAIQKAEFYFQHAAMPTLADDSGIIVEALKDELGIHTRRWGAGPKASDQEWIEFFLRRMRKESNKRARFVSVLCYKDAASGHHLFTGTCDGVITEELEADYLPGLPISACFRPDGCDRVFSALSIEQKNSSSHRGRALEKFRMFLEQR